MSAPYCVQIEVDGVSTLARFTRPPTEADLEAYRDLIRAAARKFAAESGLKVAAFDSETTGTDVETARIVSAALVVLDGAGGVVERTEWLINPGVPIPPEATAVHGITDEAAAAGTPPAETVQQIVSGLGEVLEAGLPLVIYNAPYDLTLLDREYRRHVGGEFGIQSGGLETEGELIEDFYPIAPVLDPLVLDKHVDTYRAGSRQLADVAQFHGVAFEGEAHGALADAITAGRLAQRILSRPAYQGATAEQLHRMQAGWYADQQQHFVDYRRSIGRPIDDSPGFDAWPLRPLPVTA